MSEQTPESNLGFAGRLAAFFINSKLTPIGIIASLLLGTMAVVMLPREEEPQIKVPMIDVMVAMPGATPKEVEERVSIPMEKLLYELPGIEYIYSTSMPGQSLLIARFYVGEKLEDAIVRLNQKLATNFDRIPQGVSHPLIKPHTIDDVPVLALTLHSKVYDHYTLRRLAAQVDDAIKNIHAVAETKLIGGFRRQLRILFDPARLAARHLTVNDIVGRLQEANNQSHSGVLQTMNTEVLVQTGHFFTSAAEVGRLVLGVHGNKPVYLDDVAEIIDGPQEPDNYVLFGAGHGQPEEAAVTLSVAKRPGANAVQVVDTVLAKIDSLRGHLIPAGVEVTVTRNYGETAAEKSNELLLHMGIAVFGVTLLILVFLGWRESIIVILAVPSTLALTLLLFYLYGYTLNRITLFALIFSIGILVDDAIVVVENIVRHLHLPANKDHSLTVIAQDAVNEVGNPTILATLAVIAAILPMAFVGGLMGPYMRPIPIGSTAAMLFSLIIAFTVTPWAAIRVLRKKSSPAEGAAEEGDGDTGHDHAPHDFFTRLYHRVMEPLLGHRGWRAVFFAAIIVLLLGSCSMVAFGLVKVKMLPFDNKSEFQLILDMPEGSTLEATSTVAREMAAVVGREAEVINYQIYAGTASPFNFNGLVRHYYLRQSTHLADVQINLLPKSERSAQSHDIAKRVRPAVTAIAAKYGATVAVAEVPPGPPVLQTLVAEIYGGSDGARVKLATQVKELLTAADGVVDVDWYREEPRRKLVITVDKEKAALNGISAGEISRTVELALKGQAIDLFHRPTDKEAIAIILQLPQKLRARVAGVLNIQLRANDNPTSAIPLRELVMVSEEEIDQPIYRKNLRPVIYVTADVAGAAESPAYAILALNKELAKLDGRDFGGSQAALEIFNLKQPFNESAPALKWDGEWHITLEVFRDLGLAFCAVMILIYMLMVGWFKDYWVPLVVMAAIPFSLIGILPAHWAFGAFFTATSMIGFMAGAGIVVRNSIILVDFIELRRSHGLPLAEAVVEAGAIRFRPMLLTALAVVVGASVILADPIFQGLAIALMFGEIASLLISRMAVPVLYFLLKNKRPAA
jgi:multidrug efflux pump subunit AcrB